MIEAEDLTKYYGLHMGVDGLSFKAEPGEVLGFLGPNGAGKTTTIKLLIGYFPPTRGRGAVAGHDIATDHRRVTESIGYLPENAPVYPNMSIESFLDFMAVMKRPEMSRADRRDEIDRALDAVGLQSRRSQVVRSLSKGLRQRAGLAQALLGDPDVLILDEPTAGLDPEQVQSVRNLLLDLASRGKTILLCTHVLGEVEALANRVAILNRGKLVAFDTLSAIQQSSGKRRLRVRIACDDENERYVRNLVTSWSEGDFSAGDDFDIPESRKETNVEKEAVEAEKPHAPQVNRLLREGDSWLARVTWTDESVASHGDSIGPAANIARGVHEQGWRLLELTEEAPGLEEAFLDSISGDWSGTGNHLDVVTEETAPIDSVVS